MTIDSAIEAVRNRLGYFGSPAKARQIVLDVLEAVRERDEAMLDAGTAVLFPYVQTLMPGSTAVAVWKSMIDALIHEAKGPASR